MRKKKIKAICLSLLFGCLLAAGCKGQTKTQPAGQETENNHIRIGIIFDSFILERWQRDRDVFVSAAQELGAEVNVQNANGDMKEQVAQIDYFMQEEMDVIVIVPVASDESIKDLSEAVARAQKAGIPVVAYDRPIPDSDVDLYISFDNEQVGRFMAEHMKAHLEGEGRILKICGPMADHNVPQVMEGFQEIVSETRLNTELTEHAKGWLGETGFSVTSSYLRMHGAPDGIMAGNDNIAGHAIRALSEKRLAGSVCVVGQDADLDACQRIVEGTQCMTVYKPVEKLARRAAELSVALAKGGSIDVKEVISDGSFSVPYERLEPVAVTKENMDEVITGKYHEESDIYLNVRN